MAMLSTKYVDVIVVGAGPAGAVSAFLLAGGGHSVILAEREHNRKPTIGESLPPISLRLLSQMRLLQEIESLPHIRSPGVLSSWGSERLIEDDYLLHPHGYGLHLDRTTFDEMLINCAREAGADIWMGWPVRSVSREKHDWVVQIGERLIRSRWVVDASGRRQMLTKKLGIPLVRGPALIAMVAFVRVEEGPRADWGLVEAVPDGWWYTSRVPGNQRVLIRFGDDKRIFRKLRVNFLETMKRETQHVNLVCKGAELIGPVFGRSATGCRASIASGHGWCAVGDAAQAYDPISSQGLMMALETSLKASSKIHADLSHSYDPTESYSRMLDRAWASYIRKHIEVYRAEKRWLESSFWSRRRN